MVETGHVSAVHFPPGVEQESKPEQAPVASNTGTETPEARRQSLEAVISSSVKERHTPARPPDQSRGHPTTLQRTLEQLPAPEPNL